ncbi:MAG: hypothetical protein J0M02_00990 [Planctomycetes bacterium]|nr:hypothetical protein [Planctomycetota bacterium]
MTISSTGVMPIAMVAENNEKNDAVILDSNLLDDANPQPESVETIIHDDRWVICTTQDVSDSLTIDQEVVS